MTKTATKSKQATGDEYAELPLSALIEAPDNPGGHRMDIDEEMVASIRTVGILEWASPTVAWHCTDPASHGQTHPPEQEQIDGAVKPMELERQARDEAAARRRGLLAQIFATKADELVGHVAQQAVDELLQGYLDEPFVAQLLGCEQPGQHTTGGRRTMTDEERAAVAAETASDPLRALVAVMLAMADGYCPKEYRGLQAHQLTDGSESASIIRRHYDLLTSHGYELTDEESAVLNPADGKAVA